MDYLGACGTKLIDPPQFCPKCGASLLAVTRPQKTITLKTSLVNCLLAILVLTPVLSAPIFGKAKTLKTYDHTGTIIFRDLSGKYQFSSTTADGTTYNWNCDVITESVDCSEGSGGIFYIRLDDGTEVPLVRPIFWTDMGALSLKSVPDPLVDVQIKNFFKTAETRPPDPALADKVSHVPGYFIAAFRYRPDRMSSFMRNNPDDQPVICVATGNVVDKKGNIKKQLEACYIAGVR